MKTLKKCPFLNCSYKNEKPFNVRKHILIQKYEGAVEILFDSKWMPLWKYRIFKENESKVSNLYACDFCQINDYSTRESLFSHIINNHPKQVKYEIEGKIHFFDQLLSAATPRIRKYKTKPGEYMKILYSYQPLDDLIMEKFENENKIREHLSMNNNPSNPDPCCDGMVRYNSLKYSIIEDKSTAIWKARNQLKFVAEAIKRKLQELRMIIISGSSNALNNSRNYILNEEGILEYKGKNKLVLIEGLPIIFIEYGEYTDDVWKRVRAKIN